MRTCSPFTGAGGPDFVHCSGSGTSQAVAEKSPFFPEFGNVECGLCFFFPPGIIKNKNCVISELWKHSFLQL